MTTPTLHHALQAATACAWIALVVLSLVPGRYRPHTGLPKHVELAVAFFLAALVTRFALQHTLSRLQVLAFALAAAVFQTLQVWIPGRFGRSSEWAASSAGGFLGVLLAKALLEPHAFDLG